MAPTKSSVNHPGTLSELCNVYSAGCRIERQFSRRAAVHHLYCLSIRRNPNVIVWISSCPASRIRPTKEPEINSTGSKSSNWNISDKMVAHAVQQCGANFQPHIPVLCDMLTNPPCNIHLQWKRTVFLGVVQFYRSIALSPLGRRVFPDRWYMARGTASRTGQILPPRPARRSERPFPPAINALT